jgi:outer membrane protein assembly factor BamB
MADTRDGETYMANRSGKPVKAAAFDLDAEEVSANYDLPSGIGCLALNVREDFVYFATRIDGRIHELDRSTGEIETIAQHGGDYTWSLESAPDGTLYAGTSNNSRVYEIDPADGSVTEIGPLSETEKYAYDIQVTESQVFVGVGLTENAGLYRIERANHEVSKIAPDVVDEHTSKVALTDQFAVAHQLWHKTVIVDRESGENTRVVEGLPGTFAAPDGEDRLYYAAFPAEMQSEHWPEDDDVHDPSEAAMYTFDLETGERTRQFSIPELKAEGAGGVNDRSTHIEDGKYIAVQNPESPRLFVADLESGEHELYDLPESGMEPTAVSNQAVGQYDGNPVTSRNGAIYIHDVEAGTKEKVPFPVEAKRFVEVDDTLYIGKYTGAVFYAYDGESLTRLGDLDGESRPQDLIHSEAKNAVLMATQPDYGAKTGGAIGVLDLDTHEITAHKNVIENQSLKTLAVTEDTIYAGGQTRRGLGTEPVTSSARVASFDLETMEKHWELAPVENNSSIVDLIATPERVIGIADYKDGTIFAIDPDGGTLEATASLPQGQQHHLAEDGRYYGVARGPFNGGGVVQIEPETLSVNRHQGEEIYSHLGKSTLIDDTLYYVDPDTWQLHSVGNVSAPEE